LEPFVDTIVVCTLTALTLLATGVWANPNGLEGSELTAAAFATLYGNWGSGIVTLTVVLFAFSTIISWSYYGEQGAFFIFGEKSQKPYRYIFIGFIIVGAMWKLAPVLNLSDALFGLLAFPNLLANILLTKKLRSEVKLYEADLKEGRI
jgi:AGCS family alanine or glycine:cation symporter